MEINRKQAGTIFIAFIFIISAISFAISAKPSVSQNTEEDSSILKQPLNNEQKTMLLDNDVSILTFFFMEDDEDSLKTKKDAERLNEEIGEKLLLEEIEITKFQSLSAEYNIRSSPTLLIRGKENINSPIRLEGSHDYETLKKNVCLTYSEKPEACD